MFERGAAAARAVFADTVDGYVCPLCLRSFDDVAELSREHAPPESAGGRVVGLTCRQCNSEGGHRIDHHVAAEADLRRALRGSTDREWSAVVDVNGRPARAAMRFNETGLQFIGHPQRNASEDWAAHDAAWEQLRDGGNVRFQINFRFRQRFVEIGWLRAAYIVAFAALGYRYHPVRARSGAPADRESR